MEKAPDVAADETEVTFQIEVIIVVRLSETLSVVRLIGGQDNKNRLKTKKHYENQTHLLLRNVSAGRFRGRQGR